METDKIMTIEEEMVIIKPDGNSKINNKSVNDENHSYNNKCNTEREILSLDFDESEINDEVK